MKAELSRDSWIKWAKASCHRLSSPVSHTTVIVTQRGEKKKSVIPRQSHFIQEIKTSSSKVLKEEVDTTTTTTAAAAAAASAAVVATTANLTFCVSPHPPTHRKTHGLILTPPTPLYSVWDTFHIYSWEGYTCKGCLTNLLSLLTLKESESWIPN